MWNKTILIAFILLITNGGKLRAALPIRYLNTSSAAATSAETILENYELMKMDLSSSSGFANYSNRRFQNNYKKKCLTSKIGKGLLIGGGSILVIGGICFLNISDVSARSFYAFIVAIISGYIGSALVAIGGSLAIIGGIYNASSKGRYGLVSPKPNEVGISYTFK